MVKTIFIKNDNKVYVNSKKLFAHLTSPVVLRMTGFFYNKQNQFMYFWVVFLVIRLLIWLLRELMLAIQEHRIKKRNAMLHNMAAKQRR